MSRFPFAVPCLALLSLLVFSAPLTAQSEADDYADLNDLSVAPAQLDSHLKDVLAAAKPNTYFASFSVPMPQPWVSLVPPNVHQLIVECHSGGRVVSVSPLCTELYSYCHVEFVFLDGSRYTYTERQSRVVCNDGSVTESHSRTQVSDLGLPGNRTFVFRRQVWRKAVQPPFKQLLRARAGETVDLRNRGGAPYVSGGPLEIGIAPGGVLDLRQNPAALGPIFVTDGPALLYCDTILMDPGVTFADLFTPPPIVLPATNIVDEGGVLPSYLARRSATPFSMQVAVHNTGNVDDQFVVAWSGAHTTPGQTVVLVPVGAIVHVPVTFQIAPSTPVGSVGQAQVQVSSLSAPGVVRNETLHVGHEHPGQFRYGAGTPGSNGPHAVDADGPLQAGGPAVHVSSTNADPGALGLAMFGVPVGFQYGTWQIPGEPAELYIDPLGPLFVTVVLVADPTGASAFPLQIANDPGLRGLKIDYQSIWLVTSTQWPYRLSSTPALSMTIQ